MTVTIAIKWSPLLTKVLEMEFLGKPFFIPFIGSKILLRREANVLRLNYVFVDNANCVLDYCRY